MPVVRAIVAAAGEGRRYGSGAPKQLVEIAGRTVVEWSVDRMATLAEEVVVAAPPSLLAEFEVRFTVRPGVRCVAGGDTRGRSVRRALEGLPGEDEDLIAIHDAARPALSDEDYARVVEAAATHGAAVLGRSVSDTLKRLERGRIVATVDRSTLFRAETPQVFRRDLLHRALERGTEATDESALVEALGEVRIVAVEAARPNPKLTVPGDLPLLGALLTAAIDVHEGASRGA